MTDTIARPGPGDTRNWTLEKNGETFRVTCEYEADGKWFLAVIHEGYNEAVAKAIAAAPRLLRRLESLVFHGKNVLPEVDLRLAVSAISAAGGSEEAGR